MFKLNPAPTFIATVKVRAPGGDESLTLIFKHKTRDQLKDYFENAAKGEIPDAQAVMQIVDGWKEVDAEFNEKNLSSLIQNYHDSVQAIFSTYLSELTQAKMGN